MQPAPTIALFAKYPPAAEALEIEPVVIGPTCDGGHYPLGFRQDYSSLWHRMPWGTETVLKATEARTAFAVLFANEGIAIDAVDPARPVLFPEMNASADVPEITTACWDILGKSPDQVMCASRRMVVHRKRETVAKVVACTLPPDDPRFDLGATRAPATGEVSLNHPHCARFCVLGGASCSV